MKVSFTGKHEEFTSEQQQKLAARFARLGKMAEKKGEKQAHVVLKSTRHLQKAEITMNFENKALIGEGSNGDLFTAITVAAEKLEKQIQKLVEKRRESKGGASIKKSAAANGDADGIYVVAAEASSTSSSAARVYRVPPNRRKPMTLDEALLEMEAKKDYMVFRDAETDSMAVLVRRQDGHFDLIQS